MFALLFQSTCPLRGTTTNITIIDGVWNKFQSTCPLRGTTQHRQRHHPCQNFNPRAPCGARHADFDVPVVRVPGISIHVPLAGHDCYKAGTLSYANDISIHVPLAGHDRMEPDGTTQHTNFNPRAPCGARPSRPSRPFLESEDFNPRAPCGARRSRRSAPGSRLRFQSTCPLRGTTYFSMRARQSPWISIHVPLAGHDEVEIDEYAAQFQFQSTCPLRGTTSMWTTMFRLPFDFNPRAPCGARHTTSAANKQAKQISIHVPLAGHDDGVRQGEAALVIFQSTCPLRGTTKNCVIAPAEVRFQSTCPLRGTTVNDADAMQVNEEFQSTCPLRGTTRRWRRLRAGCRFQSTCPLRGTTNSQPSPSSPSSNFNPRAPCGARPVFACVYGDVLRISIHVPLAGHDVFGLATYKRNRKFQSTCPLRGTTGRAACCVAFYDISIHVPLAGHDVRRNARGRRRGYFNPRAPCGARRTGGGARCLPC